MKEYKQIDKEVKHIVMGRKNQVAKEEGCLLVANTNIARLYYNNNGITVDVVDRLLDGYNGYTSTGYIIWHVLESHFGFKHKRFDRSQFRDVKFSDRKDKWWIVQTVYNNTGHFSRVNRVVKDMIHYIDSYDGKEKAVHIESFQLMSIREITFNIDADMSGAVKGLMNG
jgi:hypothetical protein